MRTTIPQKRSKVSPGRAWRVAKTLAILAALFCVGGQALEAQTANGAATTAAPHRAAHTRRHAVAVHLTEPAPVAPVNSLPMTPPAPEVPKWPVNENAGVAAVTWDSQGLRVEATNSSLEKILRDVSTVTGAKVEGMGTDVRIFGSYGPGRARDVISQLLEGSGYNVLMIGEQGQGTPREIVLSARTSGAPQAGNSAAQTADEDTDVDEQPQPGEQRQGGGQPFRPAFGPGGPPKTPQQVMEERQRQGQMPQPQNNPQNQ